MPDRLTEHDLVSGISVVVGPLDDPWGILGAYTTTEREFAAHDATFLQNVAHLLAVAVENQHLEAQLEDELATTFDRITDAFYALDDEWNFTYVNDRAAELIDFEDEGLLGKNVWETFDQASETKLEPEYRRAMEA